MQVVGKSCKPIPVMILGVIIGRKSYALKKYLFVLLIVIGGCFVYLVTALSCEVIAVRSSKFY